MGKKIIPILILFAAAYNLLSAIFAGTVPPGGTVIYWALVSVYWWTRAR